MYSYATKNISTIDHGVVGHGVNCQGVMASGVAAAIRATWPRAYEVYMSAFDGRPQSKPEMLGSVQIIEITPSLFVVNMFTQVFYGRDYKQYASEDAIARALIKACSFANTKELPLYIPKIGCGLGGLDWDDQVEPIVNHVADRLTTDVVVCLHGN